MTAETAPPPLPVTNDTNLWPILWKFLKVTPLVTLGIYTILSLVLEENYPFSNYPMYSNPSPERPYYMITDGDGNPLPIQTLTGVTCPKIGKIYRTKAEKLAKELDVRAVDLKPEHMQAISMEMFAYLREEGARKKQAMPAKLRLVKSYISYEDGKVIETPNLVGQE